MTKLPDEFKLVRVHWRDSSSHEGWYGRDELEGIVREDCMVMESVGWLVHDGTDHVVIARTVSDSMADGVLKIPKVTVIGMYWLEQSLEGAKENPYWAIRRNGKGVVDLGIPFDDMPDWYIKGKDYDQP